MLTKKCDITKKELMEMMEECWQFGLKKKQKMELAHQKAQLEKHKGMDKIIAEFNKEGIKISKKYKDNSIEKIEATMALTTETNWRLIKNGFLPLQVRNDEIIKLMFIVVKMVKELLDRNK